MLVFVDSLTWKKIELTGRISVSWVLWNVFFMLPNLFNKEVNFSLVISILQNSSDAGDSHL
jgi:hypothetical protein